MSASKSNGHTSRGQTGGSKQLGQQFLRPGQATTLGKIPTNRLYSRDYRKTERESGPDTVSPFVGNPLIF